MSQTTGSMSDDELRSMAASWLEEDPSKIPPRALASLRELNQSIRDDYNALVSQCAKDIRATKQGEVNDSATRSICESKGESFASRILNQVSQILGGEEGWTTERVQNLAKLAGRNAVNRLMLDVSTALELDHWAESPSILTSAIEAAQNSQGQSQVGERELNAPGTT